MGFSSKRGRRGVAPYLSYPIMNSIQIIQDQLLIIVIVYRQIVMSQTHQRTFSAHKTSSDPAKPRRRYEKIKTEFSQAKLKEEPLASKKRERNSFYPRGRQMSRQLGKEPEEIMQENLNLKSFINNLQQQLALQRGRLQMSKRKNEKYVKQLNREFEKEFYYSSKNPHSYLISGIKSQYEHIKNLYEQKCAQLDNLLRAISTTSIQELTVYIETLQTQNKTLSEQLSSYQQLRSSFSEIYSQEFKLSTNPKIYRSHKLQNDKLYTEQSEDHWAEGSSNVDVLAGMLAEEKANLNRANSIIQRYSEKMEISSRQNQQLRKKIDFLQKLIVEKDNNEHEARRQSKKAGREKTQLQEEIARLKKLVNSTETVYVNKLKKLEETEAKKYDIQKSIFEKSLLQKTQYIAKLQKEVRSLSTMLCYWKPLDQANELHESELSRHDSPKSKEMEREDRVSSLKLRASDHARRESALSDPSFLGVDLTMRMQNENDKSMRVNREEQAFLKRTITGNSMINFGSVKERPRHECSKKYSQKARKTRKVDINQIKHIGELLRYRLIGHNISVERTKVFFDAKSDNLLGIQERSNDFIKMKEIQSILQEYPFSLKEEEATLISRYVVEDSANEYVYWDEDNQIYRTIAKSIIRAFIGEYELPDLVKIKEEWSKIKGIYLSNIMAALKMISPKGLVSLSKFEELLTGLGIQMSEQLNGWLIGELVVNSTSLQELKYSLIESI